MLWPEPPDQPRFIYETSLRSAADVLRETDEERLRRALTGQNEIRLYDSGNGVSVECASCHDPHGVPSGSGSELLPHFLRKSNTGSALCLTCHSK